MENQTSRYHRIDFSCEHVGKRFSHTKRKLLWRFGRRNVENKARRAGDLQGEVHQVQLTWSLVSRKAVVLWDGKRLDHLCRRNDVVSGHSLVEFTWTDEGDPFQIVAYSSEISDIPNQYELFVNGKSFSSLPSILEIGCSTESYELSPLERLNAQSSSRSISFKMKDMGQTPPMANGRKRLPLQQCNNQALEHKNLGCPKKQDSRSTAKNSSTILANRSVESPSRLEALNISSCLEESRPLEFDESVLEDTAQQQRRLSAAGLLQTVVGGTHILHEDELQSPCSSTLEHLRQEIAADVPETEDMMSRAIIMAFSEGINRGSESLSSLASSKDEVDCDNLEMMVEADALWESLEWMKCVCESEECPIYEIQERKLSFMQQQINGLFSAVRQEILSPIAAKRTIHGIATVLNLELATTTPTDLVVVLSGGNMVDERLSRIVMEAQKYGTIEGIAFATKCSDFGICRFERSSSARRAASASLEKSVGHVGEYPRFVELNMAVAAVSSLILDSSIEETSIDEGLINSHQTVALESSFMRGQKSAIDFSMDGDSTTIAPLPPPPPPPPSMPPSLESNDVALKHYMSSGQTSLYKQSEPSISTASTEASSTDSEFFY